MAEGKFSKPRNRFQEPVQGEAAPPAAPAPQNQRGKFQRTEPMPRVIPARQGHSPEEDAMDEAFAQVREEESWVQKLTGYFSGVSKKTWLVGICSVAALLIAAVIGFVVFGSASDPYDGKILNNVIIANIHVGGLTRSQAEEVIRSATENTFTQQDMVVILPDGVLRFSPADTGAKLDVKGVVKAAFQYGRTGSKAQRESAYQASLTGNHIIGLLPYMELDQEFILNQIQSYADGFGSAYTEPSYRLEGEMPLLGQEEHDPKAPCQTLVITMGTPGLAIDVDDLFEKVLDAYSFNLFQVELGEQVPSSLPPAPDIEAIHSAVYIAPVNASMNQQTFEPIPGSYGYGFDKAQAQRLVDQAGYGESVSVPMRYIDPDVQEDELLFQDELGYCETPHSNNEKRTHNLKRVCELINGIILEPGEEFSYNDRVGERTTERGFLPAPAYSGTRLVDSVGGGVCQGSSTLYYCALTADMEITDRINHGLPVTYLPIGLDATVNWGGPDFKFRNSSNYPIKIVAEVSGGYMRMWIMGTEERDYYVKLESEITSITKSEAVYVEHSPESGYRDGQMLKASSDGYTVRSYKLRYSRETGELISKDFIVLSSYMMKRTTLVKIVGGEEEEEPPADGEGSGGEGEGEGTEGDGGSESGGGTEGGGGSESGGGTEGGGGSESGGGTEGGGSSEGSGGTEGGGGTESGGGSEGGGGTEGGGGSEGGTEGTGDSGGSTPPPASGGDTGGSTPPPASGGDTGGGSTPPPASGGDGGTE